MRRLPHDARRQQLLELGLGLFGARGYEDVVVDDIAAQAGISKGLLYHYFGSKRDFYGTCVRIAAERLVAELLKVDATEPVETVRIGLRRWFALIGGSAAAYRSLVLGRLSGEPQVQAALEAARAAITRFVLERIGCGDRPIFRSAVRAWLGAVEAATIDHLAHGDLDPEALVALHTASLADLVGQARALDPDAPIAPEVARVVIGAGAPR